MKIINNLYPRYFIPLRLSFILLGLVTLLLSCAKVQVSQDYDTNYLFSTAHTYGWNEKPAQQSNNLLVTDDLLARRFTDAIETALAKQGYIKAARPDILVSCSYTIVNKLEVDSYDTGFGFGYGRYGRYGGIGFGTGGSVRQYDQGILEINIHSGKTEQLLWKGTGTREVSAHADPDQITQNVNEMVEAVLAQFPPLPK